LVDHHIISIYPLVLMAKHESSGAGQNIAFDAGSARGRTLPAAHPEVRIAEAAAKVREADIIQGPI
jgi:hypothetical protein